MSNTNRFAKTNSLKEDLKNFSINFKNNRDAVKSGLTRNFKKKNRSKSKDEVANKNNTFRLSSNSIESSLNSENELKNNLKYNKKQKVSLVKLNEKDAKNLNISIINNFFNINNTTNKTNNNNNNNNNEKNLNLEESNNLNDTINNCISICDNKENITINKPERNSKKTKINLNERIPYADLYSNLKNTKFPLIIDTGINNFKLKDVESHFKTIKLKYFADNPDKRFYSLYFNRSFQIMSNYQETDLNTSYYIGNLSDNATKLVRQLYYLENVIILPFYDFKLHKAVLIIYILNKNLFSNPNELYNANEESKINQYKEIQRNKMLVNITSKHSNDSFTDEEIDFISNNLADNSKTLLNKESTDNSKSKSKQENFSKYDIKKLRAKVSLIDNEDGFIKILKHNKPFNYYYLESMYGIDKEAALAIFDIMYKSPFIKMNTNDYNITCTDSNNECFFSLNESSKFDSKSIEDIQNKVYRLDIMNAINSKIDWLISNKNMSFYTNNLIDNKEELFTLDDAFINDDMIYKILKYCCSEVKFANILPVLSNFYNLAHPKLVVEFIEIFKIRRKIEDITAYHWMYFNFDKKFNPNKLIKLKELNVIEKFNILELLDCIQTSNNSNSIDSFNNDVINLKNPHSNIFSNNHKDVSKLIKDMKNTNNKKEKGNSKSKSKNNINIKLNSENNNDLIINNNQQKNNSKIISNENKEIIVSKLLNYFMSISLKDLDRIFKQVNKLAPVSSINNVISTIKEIPIENSFFNMCNIINLDENVYNNFSNINDNSNDNNNYIGVNAHLKCFLNKISNIITKKYLDNKNEDDIDKKLKLSLKSISSIILYLESSSSNSLTNFLSKCSVYSNSNNNQTDVHKNLLKSRLETLNRIINETTYYKINNKLIKECLIVNRLFSFFSLFDKYDYLMLQISENNFNFLLDKGVENVCSYFNKNEKDSNTNKELQNKLYTSNMLDLDNMSNKNNINKAVENINDSNLLFYDYSTNSSLNISKCKIICNNQYTFINNVYLEETVNINDKHIFNMLVKNAIPNATILNVLNTFIYNLFTYNPLRNEFADDFIEALMYLSIGLLGISSSDFINENLIKQATIRELNKLLDCDVSDLITKSNSNSKKKADKKTKRNNNENNINNINNTNFNYNIKTNESIEKNTEIYNNNTINNQSVINYATYNTKNSFYKTSQAYYISRIVILFTELNNNQKNINLLILLMMLNKGYPYPFFKDGFIWIKIFNYSYTSLKYKEIGLLLLNKACEEKYISGAVKYKLMDKAIKNDSDFEDSNFKKFLNNIGAISDLNYNLYFESNKYLCLFTNIIDLDKCNYNTIETNIDDYIYQLMDDLNLFDFTDYKYILNNNGKNNYKHLVKRGKTSLKSKKDFSKSVFYNVFKLHTKDLFKYLDIINNKSNNINNNQKKKKSNKIADNKNSEIVNEESSQDFNITSNNNLIKQNSNYSLFNYTDNNLNESIISNYIKFKVIKADSYYNETSGRLEYLIYRKDNNLYKNKVVYDNNNIENNGNVSSDIVNVETLALTYYDKSENMKGIHGENRILPCLFEIFFYEELHGLNSKDYDNLSNSKERINYNNNINQNIDSYIKSNNCSNLNNNNEHNINNNNDKYDFELDNCNLISTQLLSYDFFSKNFYFRCKDKIDKKLKIISNMNIDNIVNHIKSFYNQFRPYTVFVKEWLNTNDVSFITKIAIAIGPKSLSVLFKSISIKYHPKGFPDLFLWPSSNRYEDILGKIVICEVKSKRDKLSEDQKWWISILIQSNIKVDFLKVIDD